MGENDRAKEDGTLIHNREKIIFLLGKEEWGWRTWRMTNALKLKQIPIYACIMPGLLNDIPNF